MKGALRVFLHHLQHTHTHHDSCMGLTSRLQETTTWWPPPPKPLLTPPPQQKTAEDDCGRKKMSTVGAICQRCCLQRSRLSLKGRFDLTHTHTHTRACMHKQAHTPLKWTQQVASEDIDDLQLTFNSFTSVISLQVCNSKQKKKCSTRLTKFKVQWIGDQLIDWLKLYKRPPKGLVRLQVNLITIKFLLKSDF